MNRYARLALITALSVVATAAVSQAWAANYSWNTNIGSWNVAPEWNPSTVPGPADTAWVVDGGTANIGALVFATCGTLAVGSANSGTVQLVSDFGSLTVGGGGELIGDTGLGTFNQTAGTNSTTANIVLGYNAGSSGSYNLSGGSLAAANIYAGFSGSGAFTQTGGTNSVTSGDVYVGTNAGSSGSFSLGGSGYLTAPGVGVGYSGNGTFTQTGGTNSLTSVLVLGDNTGSSGSYNLSGSGYLVAPTMYVGFSGSGAFTQTNGAVAVSGSVYLGTGTGSTGSYNLSGGSLAASYLYVGSSGSGSFTQTGGAVNVPHNVYMGYEGGSGTYSLSGGSLTTSGNLEVGYSGSGTFVQTGGTSLISGVVDLADLLVGSTGSYNLSGGLLRSDGIESFFDLGTPNFNFSGGTIQLLGNFFVNIPIDLNVPGGIGTVDTFGNTKTFTTEIYGPGGLNKAGAGALTLNGSDIYTAPTSVSGGTLVLPSDIPTSSFTAASGGVLQFPSTTLNLGWRFIQALAGGTVVYQNATVNGGFLRGPGTHSFPAGFNNSVIGATIDNGAVLEESGSAAFTDVTNAGQINNNSGANLTWQGGSNATSGVISVSSSATLNVSEWYNDGVITVNSGGLLNNSVSDLTSYGGARIYVNRGGTLNADSNSESVALDLDGSLLVNNGVVKGTTNVNYGATVSGSGSFGPINVMQAGAVVAATSAVPAPTSLTVTSGSISGSGNLTVSATVANAILATPNLTDVLTLSGILSGPGPITKIGPGTLVLSGTNTFGTGTDVLAGTLVIRNSYSLPGGSSLIVGSNALFAPAVPASERSSIVTPATAPVPEPSTLLLLATSLVLLVLQRGRSRIE